MILNTSTTKVAILVVAVIYQQSTQFRFYCRYNIAIHVNRKSLELTFSKENSI